MAERVDKIPGRPGEPRNGRYPWDEWFDGSIWELVQGKDFDSKIATMRQGIDRAATRRGFPVRIATRGDRLYVQAILNGQDGGPQS